MSKCFFNSWYTYKFPTTNLLGSPLMFCKHVGSGGEEVSEKERRCDGCRDHSLLCVYKRRGMFTSAVNTLGEKLIGVPMSERVWMWRPYAYWGGRERRKVQRKVEQQMKKINYQGKNENTSRTWLYKHWAQSLNVYIQDRTNDWSLACEKFAPGICLSTRSGPNIPAAAIEDICKGHA